MMLISLLMKKSNILAIEYWYPACYSDFYEDRVIAYFSEFKGRWNINANLSYFPRFYIRLLYIKMMVWLCRTVEFLNFSNILSLMGAIDVIVLKSEARWKSMNFVEFVNISSIFSSDLVIFVWITCIVVVISKNINSSHKINLFSQKTRT